MSDVEKVRYGGEIAIAKSATGVTGFPMARMGGGFFFRVYNDSGTFTDYEIRHDELEVKISADALASFYEIGSRRLLDHSPDVLGLEHVSD